MTISPVPESDLEDADLLADQFAEYYSEEYSGARFAGLDDSNARQWANDKARRVFPGIDEAHALLDQDRKHRAQEAEKARLAAIAAGEPEDPWGDDIPY